MKRCLALVPLFAACATTAPAPPPTTTATAPCAVSDEDRAWLQQVLDLWDVTRGKLLHVEGDALPWMVFFDRTCVVHVAPGAPVDGAAPFPGLVFRGRALDAVAAPHGGVVRLPDGEEQPVGPVAFATYDSGTDRPYFVLALLDVWKSHPKAKTKPHLSTFIVTTAEHELTHTTQLPALAQAMRPLVESTTLREPPNDDVVEHRFADDAEYVAAWRKETDTAFAAAFARDDRERLRLAGDFLRQARARQQRWFVGDDAVYARLEAAFLNQEGSAEWVRYRLVTDVAALELAALSDEERAAFLRGGADNRWSQEEGLAIYLLVDALVPGWQERLQRDIAASPFDMLEQALAP